jgi:hypothetical protein
MIRQSRRDLCRLLAGLPLLAQSALAGCASKPSNSSLEQAIREARFDEALSIVTALRSSNADTAELRLLTGASLFVAQDFGEARRAFLSADAAGIYLFPERDGRAEDTLLRTDVRQDHWVALSTLRLEKSLAETVTIDPLSRVMTGSWPPERYVQERVSAARRVADATILSIASSPGREAMLDDIASARIEEYRCTGYFVAAEVALPRDDRSGAREALTMATQRDVPLLEFHVAQAEHQRLR